MIAGLDSAFPPSTASLLAAKAGGVRLWAGYFAGPNIYHGWSHNDFQRVKDAGLATLAYCSGWSIPQAMRTQSSAWEVPICLDVEGGIRDNGAWVQGWLDASGAGLYGNAPVFAGHRASFYILAAYPGIDPQRTWRGTPPGRPCGWQWQGTHHAYGATVDSSWLDDEFAGLRFSSGGGVIVTPPPPVPVPEEDEEVFSLMAANILHDFRRGTDFALWHRTCSATGDTAWQSLGGRLGSSRITGGVLDDRELRVVVSGATQANPPAPDGKFYDFVFDGSKWSGPHDNGGRGDGGLILATG